MPLYLARGPSTFAFLIRARDRDHLNYIIDAFFDPGLFEVEVYDGPLSLSLSLPAELDGETDFADAKPDLQVRFTGSTECETLLALPTVQPMDEFEDEWRHLRRRAFPHFSLAVDDFAEDAEEGAKAPREIIETAIHTDVIEQGRRALHHDQHAESDEPGETEQRQMMGISVPVGSVLSGGTTHAQWSRSDWDAQSFKEPTDATEELQRQVDRAIDRFGEVNLTLTPDGARWRLGRPVIAEGSTLTEAIEQAQKRGRPVEH